METPRLILRRWEASDLEPFAALNADPEVMEFFPALLSRDQAKDTIDRIEAGIAQHGFGFWAAARKDTGAFIGFVGLNVASFAASFTPCVEIGWRLAREHWGQGFATEAARACLADAFGRCGLEEVLAWTYVGNLRSRNVMERIGMSPVQEFEHPNLAAGHPLRPHVLYRIKSA